MYTTPGFANRAALKAAVESGAEVRYFCPSCPDVEAPRDGILTMEGRHVLRTWKRGMRRWRTPWQAAVEVRDGLIVRVL